jgi:hypothetical protein
VYIDITEAWQPTQRPPIRPGARPDGATAALLARRISYQLVVDDVRWRYDLDHDRHPDMALHEHPRGHPEDDRIPFTPWTADDLLPGLVARLVEEYSRALCPWPHDGDE